jgi:exonuclease V gamma subunit
MSREAQEPLTLTVTAEEAEELLHLLEAAAVAKRVETHRTDARAYRAMVAHEEEVISTVLERVRRLTAPESART